MKPYVSTALAAVLVLALPACQQQKAESDTAATAAAGSVDALAGTWKVDLASLKFEGKPDEYLLKDGSYSCASCIPPLTVAADGAMHAVADRPYYDNFSVKAVDDKTVETHQQKGGKEVSSFTMAVSADGNVLTTKFKDMNTPGQTIEGSSTAQRAGPAPAGAHAISGQWKTDKVGDYTEEALDVTFAIAGNSVTMNSQGQTYTAELGGPAVAVQGDTGGTSIKVTREGANGLRETNIRDGKEIGYGIITPSADGKSVSYVYTDTRDGSKVSWTGNKTS
jgi:hypothetical protein